MKRILLILSFFIGSFSVAHAQDDIEPGKKAEQVRALYVAYITQQLNLTAPEAEKFWPIHSQFEADLKAVDPNMQELPRQQAVLDIKKKYQDRFAKVLGNNRTDDFFRKDAEFRKRLVDRLRQMRQQNRQNQRPNKKKSLVSYIK